MFLSIIVLARNEEKNIAACLKSILKATEKIGSREIIVVDSNSTDRTVIIARKFPVRIFRIPDDRLCSPAAGVYVGVKKSKGEYVHIAGADFLLPQDWFEGVFDLFSEHKKLAMVNGRREQKSKKSRYLSSVQDKFARDKLGEIAVGGGGGTFRGDLLRKYADINPWISYFEEPLISVNLRHKGFKLMRIDKQMFTHVDKQRTFRQSMHRTFMGGRDAGRALRQYVGDERFSMLLEIIRHYGKGKGPRKKAFFFSMSQMAVSLLSMAYGFAIGSKRPSTYPLNRIKELRQQ